MLDTKWSCHFSPWAGIHTIWNTRPLTLFPWLSEMTVFQSVEILTYLLTPWSSPSWEANWFSASQGIPPHFMEPEGSLPHRCLPPVPILSQLDPVHTPTSHFLKIHLNIIFPCLVLPSGLFPSGFPTKATYMPLLSPIRAT